MVSEIRQFHTALSGLRANGAHGALRILIALGQELLEAVEAQHLAPSSQEEELPTVQFSSGLTLEWANMAAARLFGMSPDELAGKPLACLARARYIETYEWGITEARRTRLPVMLCVRDLRGHRVLCEYRPVPGTRSVTVQLRPCVPRRAFEFAFAPRYHIIE